MAKMSFEKAMDQLERIVQDLESGDLPLEKALKHFEEGIQLSRQCAEKLEETEKKINLLLEQTDGTLAPVAFDPDDPPKIG